MKTLASLLIFGLMSPMQVTPVAAASSWTYINNADDGSLYFGRNLRRIEGITFIELKVESSPDGRNGDAHSWTTAFNCKNKTYQKNGEFIGVKKSWVAHGWLKFACKK